MNESTTKARLVLIFKSVFLKILASANWVGYRSDGHILKPYCGRYIYEKYSMRGQVKRQIQCKAKASTVFILRHRSSGIFFIQNKHMIINPLIYFPL